MPNGITRDTFKESETDTQRLILFDLLSETATTLKDHVDEQRKACSEREQLCSKKFKKLGTRNTVVSAGSGLIGGFLAVIAKSTIWK